MESYLKKMFVRKMFSTNQIRGISVDLFHLLVTVNRFGGKISRVTPRGQRTNIYGSKPRTWVCRVSSTSSKSSPSTVEARSGWRSWNTPIACTQRTGNHGKKAEIYVKYRSQNSDNKSQFDKETTTGKLVEYTTAPSPQHRRIPTNFTTKTSNHSIVTR